MLLNMNNERRSGFIKPLNNWLEHTKIQGISLVTFSQTSQGALSA